LNFAYLATVVCAVAAAICSVISVYKESIGWYLLTVLFGSTVLILNLFLALA